MTGQYTELYFPSHNVRYIAIDDGVDSEKGESEMAAASIIRTLCKFRLKG